MLVGKQPRDVAVSITDFKSRDLFSPPPICDATNGESAPRARRQGYKCQDIRLPRAVSLDFAPPNRTTRDRRRELQSNE
ncbi:hypothetical protein F2P81_006078 [Scophthalmus maximus]|uniref:Uncharacterized protein n=1 Tax=Scophthalmus maximus TaxID=52904 RepID=A0A6A4T4R7_SCOMX|nr:hypothetical protein F2P81_006078 [Scophthalmus maximus]